MATKKASPRQVAPGPAPSTKGKTTAAKAMKPPRRTAQPKTANEPIFLARQHDREARQAETKRRK